MSANWSFCFLWVLVGGRRCPQVVCKAGNVSRPFAFSHSYDNNFQAAHMTNSLNVNWSQRDIPRMVIRSILFFVTVSTFSFLSSVTKLHMLSTCGIEEAEIVPHAQRLEDIDDTIEFASFGTLYYNCQFLPSRYRLHPSCPGMPALCTTLRIFIRPTFLFSALDYCGISLISRTLFMIWSLSSAKYKWLGRR